VEVSNIDMEGHIKALAILRIVLGAFGVVAGIVVFAIFGGIAGIVGAVGVPKDPDAAIAIPILGGLGTIVLLIAVVVSVPSIIAGWGLLNFKPWARILTIIISALDILNVPLGTVLGVYGLWVLLNKEGEAIFERNSVAPSY
jgi:hypothetical protein